MPRQTLSFAPICAVVLACLVSVVSCKQSNSNTASIAASVPGIDPALIAAVPLTYQLTCDPTQANLQNGTAAFNIPVTTPPTAGTLVFPGAATLPVGSWCYMSVTATTPSALPPNQYKWTSLPPQIGLFYESTRAQLPVSRSLSLTLYTTYTSTPSNSPATGPSSGSLNASSTISPSIGAAGAASATAATTSTADPSTFSATFLVNFGNATVNSAPPANSATLTCSVPATSQSVQLVPGSSTELSILFALPTSQFTTAQSCTLSLLTGASLYSSAATSPPPSITVSSTSPSYGPFTLSLSQSP